MVTHEEWYFYEQRFRTEGFLNICGIDEAGRGPLAGPVCAAAVILKEDVIIRDIDDSKKLSASKREQLFHVITENALDYSVAFVDEKKIDEINILNATHLAMFRAVSELSVCPDMILVDGNSSPDFGIKTLDIVKGDSLSVSIACASILAKVSRDRLVSEIGEKYPQYFFKKHKGYGTKLHIEMIKRYGLCEFHRKTFTKKYAVNYE
ncbi:MAG: ribonuclease HII [Oscillospiraceae bacterium]|jgi:ribonuclease HII|nr:ribonuclease HII [Oscillospiraceae bacterium]